MRALLLVLLLSSTALSGCAQLRDLLDDIDRPQLAVERTVWRPGEWTTDPVFLVDVKEPDVHDVRIKAVADDGTAREANGQAGGTLSPVTLSLPDGTWTVTYWVDGHKWETVKAVRLDTTPPSLSGLPLVADAPTGSYLLGAGASVESDAEVRVTEQRTGVLLALGLPVQLNGLADGVHAYDVLATDDAGNVALATVQVRVGDALALPTGQFTFGVVARYRQDLLLWDLTNASDYLSRASARQEAAALTANGYLGSGVGLTPDDPEVKAVVADVVASGDNAFEAALALFKWMAAELEYDQGRLDDDDLLDPAQTIANGGGVCRDLAGLYVSLLRAAGVPARLVAGYLTGEVNGFHAWAEVYVGGDGPSPWMPVDVSPIDGPYTTAMLLQSFGIHLPSHLPLRAVTEEQEQSEWSQAMLVATSFRLTEPQVELERDLSTVFETSKRLCIDQRTLARRVATQCTGEYFPDFAVQAELVLDYGVQVVSASRGSTVTLTVAYPVDPTLEFSFYGARFTTSPTEGTATATLQR